MHRLHAHIDEIVVIIPAQRLVRLSPLDVGDHAATGKPRFIQRVESQLRTQPADVEVRARQVRVADRDSRLSAAAESAQPEFAEIADLDAGIDTGDRLGDTQARNDLPLFVEEVEIRLVEVRVGRHE